MILRDIAGVPVPQLAERFGTPLFVYDAAVITERIERLRAFPTVRYAQKANSNIAVLDLMRRHGVLVDAVSDGEITRALAAGYEPHEIAYTSDIFDRATLQRIAELGLPVNCGSPDMVGQYAEAVPGGRVTLRINPGFGHGHSQKTNTGGPQSKHGIWHEDLPEVLGHAAMTGVTVSGLHMHIGSGTDLKHLSQVCDAMKAAARQVGPSLRTISAGGGLPAPYRDADEQLDVDAYADLWLQTRDDVAAELGLDELELEVEPGRYLVAECGYLIAEVRAVKQAGENRFTVLNAGFNNLARPILYGAYHAMSLCPADDTDRPTMPTVVAGPLCESGDIFTQTDGGFVQPRELPEARVGDHLVMHGAGAYAFGMGSNYNSMPLAAEVLIADGTPHLVRRRQTADDLIAGESIPRPAPATA